MKESDTLNITGIKSGSSSEIVNVRLKSGVTTSTNISCFLLGSTVFDPNTSDFGYTGCDSNFRFIDLSSGALLRTYTLPGLLSQTVVDPGDTVLIGQYYESNTNSNYVVKLDLNSGIILAKSPVNFGSGILACSYFYSPSQKEYVLLKADSTLISINPDNGVISRSVKVGSMLNNAVYDVSGNRLIGMTYSHSEDQNYIEVIDTQSGDLISRVQIKQRNDYHACASAFDPITNCYIVANAHNTILFINVETGEVENSYPLNFAVSEFSFWRSIQ